MAKRKKTKKAKNDFPTKEELEEVLGGKNKQQPEKAEEFFVSVSNSGAIRVSLLQSRKLTLESMKLFQTLKHIRNQKIEEKNKLRKQLKQISSAIIKIKLIMPKVNIIPEKKEPVKKPEPPPKPEPPKPVQPKPVQPEPEPPKPPTELERIEAELAEIEGRLSGLS